LQPIWLDYARIDRGHTRAQENSARRQRNLMRRGGKQKRQPAWKTVFLAAQEVVAGGGENVGAAATGR
jgi:hypothetical protein